MLQKNRKALIVCVAITLFGFLIMGTSRLFTQPEKADNTLALGLLVVIAGVAIPIIANRWSFSGWTALLSAFGLLRLWVHDPISQSLSNLSLIIVGFFWIIAGIQTITSVVKKKRAKKT